MRVAFLGNAPWSQPTLRALARSDHEVALVVTRPPRPGRRGGASIPTPVAQAAAELELPLSEIETVKEGPGFDSLAGTNPEALVVVAYGEILPAAVLDLPSIAPVNLHFSLLPELRGAAPVQRAIMRGLAVTGVTTIRMDEGMDTGPILLQAKEAIAPEDDSRSLGDRLAGLGARIVVDTLDRLEEGDLTETQQDEARATYAPKLRPEERVIDWQASATDLERLVRGLSPSPGATTRLGSLDVKVLSAVAITVPEGLVQDEDVSPGSLALSSKDVLAVRTGEGLLRLDEVAPEGRSRMSGPDLARGNRLSPGDRFG